VEGLQNLSSLGGIKCKGSVDDLVPLLNGNGVMPRPPNTNTNYIENNVVDN